jgi:hypothetical protein
MPRHLLIGVLIGLFVSSGCAGPRLIVQNARGQEARVDLSKVQPVKYDKKDLQEAVEPYSELIAGLVRQHDGQLRLRLTSAAIGGAGTADLAFVDEYLTWCQHRGEPGDCLDVRDPRMPGLTVDAKRAIALRMAFSSALREVAEVVRGINPIKVEALMLASFGIYLAPIVFPDPITKALSVIMTANLIAFVGWIGFHNIIQGYREMRKDAEAAENFGQLQEAGRRYGSRMGPSMVRIVTALVTWGLGAAAGVGRPATGLPGGALAAVNAEAQGFRLAAVSGGSVTVSSSGTVTLVLTAQATNPEGGGGAPRLGPLKRFEIDKYGRFNAGCRVGDELCGHEVLQNSWLREHGHAARRGADASRDNPAIAVDRPLHDRIAVEQRKLGLFEKENLAKMSAEENIRLNAQAMKAAGVPEASIRAVAEEARRYAASLPR